MDTRDSFHVGLLRQGVKARLPKAWQPEECIGTGKSLGLIEVELGPIRWVNVRRLSEHGGEVSIADLAVPDIRLHRFPEVERIAIHSIGGKAPPSRWAGNDLGIGILEALNRDPMLQDELPPPMKTHPDQFGDWSDDEGLQIRAYPEQRCWTLSLPIETKLPVVLGIFGGRRLRVPPVSEIDAYQHIGRILLNARLQPMATLAIA